MAQPELRQLSCLAGATSVTTLSTFRPQRRQYPPVLHEHFLVLNLHNRENQDSATVLSTSPLHTISSTSFVMNHFPEAWGRVSSLLLQIAWLRSIRANKIRKAQKRCLRPIRPLLPADDRPQDTYPVSRSDGNVSGWCQVQRRCCPCN